MTPENDPDTKSPNRIDRMDDSFSYVAAIVAGVAFIVLAGCMSLFLSDHRMASSTSWWSALTLSSSIIYVSIVGYFRPDSPAIYVPLLLSGVVTLALCIWHSYCVVFLDSGRPSVKDFDQSIALFAIWIAWAVKTVRRLHNRSIKMKKPLP